MKGLNEFLIPYIISNLVFLASIWAAAKRPIWARFFFTALFIWASFTNLTTALTTPAVYLDYAGLSFLNVYKDFINGFFAARIQLFVITIAVCQLFLALGLIMNGTMVRIACAGGIIFGLAIAPFGVGSGFPSTVFMAAALFILLKKYHHDYIWKLKQYTAGQA